MLEGVCHTQPLQSSDIQFLVELFVSDYLLFSIDDTEQQFLNKVWLFAHHLLQVEFFNVSNFCLKNKILWNYLSIVIFLLFHFLIWRKNIKIKKIATVKETVLHAESRDRLRCCPTLCLSCKAKLTKLNKTYML